MILTRNEILKEIKNGNIKIVPFNKKNVGPISIDLTLDNQFALPIKTKINLNEDTDYKKYFKKIKANSVELKPDDFILGITKEKICLPDNIMGFLSGRSRFARIGLLIHATADIIQPGINNKQVFEIKNTGKSTLFLKPGIKIGQLVFMQTKGRASYEGRFKRQESI